MGQESNQAKMKIRRGRGRNSIASNGQTLCENLLRKGKTYIGANGLVNPVKFANFDGKKFA